MHQQLSERSVDLDPRETAEWLEALDQIVEEAGSDRVNFLLNKLTERARDNGVTVPIRTTTDYINTISVDEEVPYPGDRALERRIKIFISLPIASLDRMALTRQVEAIGRLGPDAAEDQAS